MKHIVGISFSFFCLWSVNAHAEVSPLWNGHYRVQQFGEKLIDGSEVYIQYDFQIDSKNDQASVAMTTWHAPISCVGNYNIKMIQTYWRYNIQLKIKILIAITQPLSLRLKGKGIIIM